MAATETTPTASARLADRLCDDVVTLAGEIGERHVWLPDRLAAAADFVEAELAAAGYRVRREPFGAEGRTVHNLEAELPGSERPGEVVVVGAHYDSFCGTHLPGGKRRRPSAAGTPGADDNANGVAGLLALARIRSCPELSFMPPRVEAAPNKL